MTNHKHFCTCKDTNCKLHPFNHNLGCDPCIRKNLNAGEIPSCFFHLIDDDISHLSEFTIESFVKFYLENKKT
ncbi:DUF6485 family protein [Petroclostridium sp. X23]|nr:DUF6485 family protein [Petroclostridium sp. X23]WHH59855.1 DUF6485 family protein [Petroclostridium sp. X23]